MTSEYFLFFCRGRGGLRYLAIEAPDYLKPKRSANFRKRKIFTMASSFFEKLIEGPPIEVNKLISGTIF